MLETQNVLREEIKEKEFYKEQAQQTMKMYLDLKDSSDRIQKELESESQRRKLEVQLIEEKNASLSEQVTQLEAEKQERIAEVSKLNLMLIQRDKDIEELQMQTLNIKSQVIEKDGQIENLMERLAQKGEETAALSSQYLELKNYMLDQELFETKYSVTRVPLDDIVIGANV